MRAGRRRPRGAVATGGRGQNRWSGTHLAETFQAYLAVRYLRDRIGEANALAIEAGIPHRLAVLDAQEWDGQWCPVVPTDCASTGAE